MVKLLSKTFVLFFLSMGFISTPALAHFQMIIPDDTIVTQNENQKIHVDLLFWHPFQGFGMPMAKPDKFGVMLKGKKEDLLGSLKATKKTDVNQNKFDTYQMLYTVKRPGDHIFYVEPQPYWEPAEEKFIVHYTKTILNAFGMEIGWDAEVGSKAEIVPLTRPYGLWAGNSFQGLVKVKGKPVAFTDVEVEYYNENGALKAPDDPYITQVVKTDANGVFSYTIPWDGWWGFAALTEDSKKMKKDGKEFPVEIGAVIWVNAKAKIK